MPITADANANADGIAPVADGDLAHGICRCKRPCNRCAATKQLRHRLRSRLQLVVQRCLAFVGWLAAVGHTERVAVSSLENRGHNRLGLR